MNQKTVKNNIDKKNAKIEIKVKNENKFEYDLLSMFQYLRTMYLEYQMHRVQSCNQYKRTQELKQ